MIVVEFLDSRRWSFRSIPKSLYLVLALPAALFGWAWFNKVVTGDWFNFIHVQSHWGRTASNPISTLWHAVRGVSVYDQRLALFTIGIAVAFVLLNRWMRWSERIWAWAAWGVPLFTGIYSMPRYALVIFPLYLGFARAPIPTPLRVLLLSISAIVQAYLFLHWPLNTSLVI